MKFTRYLLLTAIFFLNGGCDLQEKPMTSCDEYIPNYSDFQKNTVFSALKYRKKIEVDNSEFLQRGYDLIADSKFNYNSCLQFTFKRPDENDRNKLCVSGAFLRMTLPLNENQKQMLASFTNELSKKLNMNPLKLKKEIDTAFTKKSSYQMVDKRNDKSIKVGIAHHAFRGDFFVVSVEET